MSNLNYTFSLLFVIFLDPFGECTLDEAFYSAQEN